MPVLSAMLNANHVLDYESNLDIVVECQYTYVELYLLA